jgi:hypothetical protein
MSPASTARREKSGVPLQPSPLPYPGERPYPTADLLLQLSKEIVVDWQLPSDLEHKN